jgi:hypothetical protein
MGRVGDSVKEGTHSASYTAPPEATSTAAGSPSETASSEPENEFETDSPFDNANFLSFEEWKRKNLAEVGQSPENVGQGRAAASNQPARRRPVNVNALDSLGDEGEIEIDFSGFGSPGGENVAKTIHQGKQGAGSKAMDGEGKSAPSSWALSKDAGKTCKERFNYASFDCAATVLKTNKQAKSSTSVLVENKDSYMLNECSADNKFLIVELCDEIFVDTVVLANYEFFSSMFRHFRVSVSDRYPVKMERWRTLGTFEARNSRDIQPFLITEPQIWARYLRIEFLTQFGNEFYCPLSLLRVHGTTMMEQFRREEEEARGIEDDDEDLETQGVEVAKPAEDSGPLSLADIPPQAGKPEEGVPEQPAADTISASQEPPIHSAHTHGPTGSSSSPVQIKADTPTSQSTHTPQSQDGSNTSETVSSPTASVAKRSETTATAVDDNILSNPPSMTPKAEASLQTKNSASSAAVVTSSPRSSQDDSASNPPINSTASASSSSAPAKASSNSTVAGSQAQSQSRGSSTQPNTPVPSTQESFFKSIHKRLQYLEANSTLSLQYIEEQSRALRDAFMKVEKRQLAKTEKFLDHLNSTVMLELKSFRSMYDQLWQSTVIELESMKERQNNEVGEIGTRLSLMADELVWQKRMAVVQSTLLLLCLGLVLFVRSGTLGTSSDVPIVQQLGNKYTSFFESSPPRSPPDTSSGIARRRRTFKNMWKSDTSANLSDHHSYDHDALSDAETDGLRSPIHLPSEPQTPHTISSTTPNTPHPLPSLHINGLATTDTNPEPTTPTTTLSDQASRIRVLETQSGPATPNGTRDSRPSWEEVDRAMDLLKAEEQELGLGQAQHEEQEQEQEQEQGQEQEQEQVKVMMSPNQAKKNKKERAREKKKQKRSPLRRAQSGFDGSVGFDEG